MDVTTLSLAVDSSQVNSASVALQKMAAEGFKAETVVAKLGNTATLQGRALNAGIVKNAAAAADSIKGLTGATSALSSAQDFSRTTAGLSAAAAQANAATGAVRSFGAAVAASAAVAPKFAAAPQATTVQQIAQTPVSVLARQGAPAVDIDTGPINAAAAALDKLVDQMGKVQAASRSLAGATQAQGAALDGAASKAGAVAAAYDKIEAAAARASGSTSKFNAFGSLGGAQAPAQFNAFGSLSGQSFTQAPNVAKTVAAVSGSAAGALGGNRATSAFSGVGGQVEDLGKKAKLTAFQTQQLSFQLNDLFVQMASGQSPLTALIQQGSQLNGTFGGTKGTLSAVASLLTPVRLAIGGAVAAVGALGFAFMKGAEQSKAFADAVVLSGNYAGQTEGKINALAKSVASSTNSSVSSVREYANELIKTGQIGPQVFSAATEAAAAYGKATGKTAQEVAADFAKMAQGPGKFAEEIDRSMNLFTAAELDAIKAMEDNGRAADAQGLIYEKLQARLKGLEPNLGTLEKLLRGGKNAWSDFWDAAYGIGRAETIEGRIEKLQQQAARASQPGALGVQSPLNQSISNAANTELKGLQRRAFRQSENADAEALEKEVQKEAKAADKVVEGYLKRGKAQSEYKKKSDELERSFKAKEIAGVAVSKEDQAIARKELKKEFTPAKGPANTEAGQILREQLADDLSAFKIALDREKEALAFHQREMQGVYQAGGISLKAFFDDKRATIADGVTAEVAQLDKEIARLKEYQAAIKDPSEKIQIGKRIGQVEAQKADVKTNGERALVLANQEAQASFKALDDQIDNYRANLLQMSGDELGAARIRASIAEGNASVLATQSGGRISQADIDRQTALTKAAAEFNDVQRQAGFLAQSAYRAQEATFLAADLNGKSLRETEDAIYAVRVKELEQLGALAAKAAELAKESTRPEVKQYAADLALAYAKAAAAIDPALQRLQAAQKELAAGIANTLNQGIANLPQEYSARRQDANQEVKDEKERYNRRIDNLEGYLANATAKTDRARIQQKIKDLEAERDKKKGESKGSSLLKSVNTSILQPMASGVFSTVNKLLVTDPLQKYIEGQLKGLTEGGGAIATYLKDALGIKDAKVDPKVLAEQAAATATDTLANSLTAQTSAVQASTLALEALANAANSAAGNSNSRTLTVEAGSRQAAPSMGDFTRADRALEASQSASADPAAAQATADARQAMEGFGASATTAANDIVKLAQAAGQGGGALGMLPTIVNLFQSAVSAVSASMAASGATNSGGGIMSAFASMFGGSGGASSAAVAGDTITSFYFHSGGVVGGPARTGSVSPSVFAGAPRYHTGGIVGQKADGARSALAAAALKAGEVPAILMKNEEVLRADDPRHRGNLGSEVFAKIMQNKGENSASVLQGLLTRLGVKDDEPAVSGALKVAGARELGGPVSAGKLYRVNEKRPELLNVGNKQYLMMGAQGGSVDPNPQQGKGAGPVQQLHVTVVMPQGANANTANQFGVIAGRQMQNALRRNG